MDKGEGFPLARRVSQSTTRRVPSGHSDEGQQGWTQERDQGDAGPCSHHLALQHDGGLRRRHGGARLCPPVRGQASGHPHAHTGW